MPRQETFLEKQIGDRRVEVIKNYDIRQAREAFDEMNEAAQASLWKSLGISESYEGSELPRPDSVDGRDFLWEELLESSREEGNVPSFFIVSATNGTSSRSLYVSSDWPSAERLAQETVESI
jgi:hypothetical protein